MLLKGIAWGIALSILVGPILFALVQAALERGFRAGIALGLGIWISDILFILSIYWGVSYVLSIAQAPNFKMILGIIGGIILIIIGLATFLSKPPKIVDTKFKLSASYFALWTKGFLINTVNPFTFFFWISITTAVVLENQLSSQQAGMFYGGILGTVMLTDSIKVALAKLIRNKLKPKYIHLARRISGAALFLFGIALIIRVLAV